MDAQPGHTFASELCTRCASIDLQDIWTSRSNKLELGPVSTWSTETCRFCAFLKEVLVPFHGLTQQRQHESSQEQHSNSTMENSMPFYLYSMKTRDANLPLLRMQRIWPRMIVLSHLQHSHPHPGIPYIAANPHSVDPPSWLRPVLPLIDFNQPRRWLATCQELHAGHCTKSAVRDMANLKLINVHTSKVVEASGSETFAALSYVWGNRMNSPAEAATYPRTVRDAIIATQKLGYGFLWVDKYCIDQSDEHDFGDQLQQMDTIYRQAIVTLVAAAGDNADYGLPGISRTREPAPSVSLPQGYVSVVRGLPDVKSSRCRWATRAWTYQEGLLSTKRLVFTEDQLYFECQGYYCVEMLDISCETWKEMHHRENPYILQRYRALPNMGVFPLDGCGIDPWDIYHRVFEYSHRSLTYEADILKGISGILQAFEREINPQRHLFGIAFSGSAVTSANVARSTKVPTFCDSLRWTLRAPSARRPKFPSWSWTGWYGIIAWPKEYNANCLSRPPRRPPQMRVHGELIGVSIELRNGELLDWASFQERYDEISNLDMFTGIICIEAWATPIAYSHDGDLPEIHMKFVYEDGTCIPTVAQRTTNSNFRTEDTLLAVHFWQTMQLHLMIVKDFGSHWERVAMGVYPIEAQIHLERVWTSLRLG